MNHKITTPDSENNDMLRRAFWPIVNLSRKSRKGMSRGAYQYARRILKLSKSAAQAFAMDLTRVDPTRLTTEEARDKLQLLGVKIGFSTLYNIASNKVNLDSANCVQIFFEKTGNWDYSTDGINAVASMNIFKTPTGISYSVKRLKEKSSQTF